MEIKGRIIQLLQLQTGQGKNGEWRKQEFILETQEQYPKKVCISVWGDKIDQFNLAEGAEITASINIESREYNGRWYTDVRAWKVEAEVAAAAQEQVGAPAPSEEPPFQSDSDEEDDLPF